MGACIKDEINIVSEMLTKYFQANGIDYGISNIWASDTFFKRKTAELFYARMKSLKVSAISNHADFRLVSLPILEVIKNYGEQHLFLQCIFPYIGFNSAKIYYAQLSREVGQSKYFLCKTPS